MDQEDSGEHEPALPGGPPMEGEAAQDQDQLGELVQRCRAGDPAAINEIVDRYYSRLVRIVRVRMFARLRSKCEPEEVVDSALAVALQKFPQFEHREDASVLAWLSQIAFNKMLEKARYFDADCRRTSLEVCFHAFGGGREDSAPLFELAAKDPLPPERAAKEEYRLLVDELVSELAPDYRDVIQLRNYERGSWKYVGSRMNRSEGAVQMIYRRAMACLKENPRLKQHRP